LSHPTTPLLSDLSSLGHVEGQGLLFETLAGVEELLLGFEAQVLPSLVDSLHNDFLQHGQALGSLVNSLRPALDLFSPWLELLTPLGRLDLSPLVKLANIDPNIPRQHLFKIPEYLLCLLVLTLRFVIEPPSQISFGAGLGPGVVGHVQLLDGSLRSLVDSVLFVSYSIPLLLRSSNLKLGWSSWLLPYSVHLVPFFSNRNIVVDKRPLPLLRLQHPILYPLPPPMCLGEVHGRVSLSLGLGSAS